MAHLDKLDEFLIASSNIQHAAAICLLTTGKRASGETLAEQTKANQQQRDAYDALKASLLTEYADKDMRSLITSSPNQVQERDKRTAAHGIATTQGRR